jgi:hypothetical protein
MATINGAGWRLSLPAGFPAKKHKACGCESGAIARGFVGDGPVTVIVQVKQLETGFRGREGHLTSGEYRLEVPDRRGRPRLARLDVQLA